MRVNLQAILGMLKLDKFNKGFWNFTSENRKNGMLRKNPESYNVANPISEECKSKTSKLKQCYCNRICAENQPELQNIESRVDGHGKTKLATTKLIDGK